MKAWQAIGGASIGVSIAFAAPIALAQRSPSPVALDVAQSDQYTRMSFKFAGGRASVTPTLNGETLQLVFSRPGDVDLAELRSTPPRFLKGIARLGRPDGRLALSLTLAPGVRYRQIVDGEALVVDLLAPSTEQPAAPRLTAPVQVQETRDATEIRVSWSRPVQAAIVQRGETAWMVFANSAPIDLRSARRAGRRHTGITSAAVDDGTALRIGLAAEMRVSARAENGAWILRIAPTAERTETVPVRRELTLDGRGRMAVDFGREGVVRQVVDPVLRDRFFVGLVAGPTLGVEAQRSAPEAVISPSAHGALITPRDDALVARFEGNALLIYSGAKTATPVTAEYTPSEPSLGSKSRLDLSEHANVPSDLVLDRRAQLERRAAAEGTARGSSVSARLELARFLVAHELSAEALGVLKVATINQPQISYDPGFRLLRGVASAMMGREKDAEVDLGASGLADDPVAALWRGYVAAANGNWLAAQRNLERGRDAMGMQSRSLRARFLSALAEAAINNRDLAAAAASAKAAEAEAQTQNATDLARLQRAIAMRLGGNAREALDILSTLTSSRDEAVSSRAAFEAIQAQQALSEITPEDAAAALDALRFRWRGGEFELSVNQALGALYVQLGRWRDGLDVMRAVSNRYPDHPLGREIRVNMGAIFEGLFLDGDAQKLDSIQALGLFYDFKELTPIGPSGDRMVRALAGRLADLDLLEQAADLLKYQIEQRLDGMAKAQIASDLAMIYLQDKKPEQALGAIASTRQPRMPAALVAERRILEAKAQVELGRSDIALELIERDRSVEAQRLRADIAWRAKEWPRATAELRALAALLPKDKPLDDADRAVVLRAGIAAVFADDKIARQNLRRDFAAAMTDTPDKDAFDIVTGDLDIDGVSVRDLANRIAQTDMLDRFMQSLRARLQAPGGVQTSAATPASSTAKPPA